MCCLVVCKLVEKENYNSENVKKLSNQLDYLVRYYIYIYIYVNHFDRHNYKIDRYVFDRHIIK